MSSCRHPAQSTSQASVSLLVMLPRVRAACVACGQQAVGSDCACQRSLIARTSSLHAGNPLAPRFACDPPRASEPGRRGARGHSSCRSGTPLPCARVSGAPALMQRRPLPQMGQAQMVRLDDVCRELGVPLLCARAYGLVGYVRASLPEHTVVESKPDNTIEDLRCGPRVLEQPRGNELECRSVS